MSIAAAPNLGGGLWMSGMSDSSISLGNGNANIGQNVDCGTGPGDGGGNGGGGNGGGGGGSCTNPNASGGSGGSSVQSFGGGSGSGGSGGSSGGGFSQAFSTNNGSGQSGNGWFVQEYGTAGPPGPCIPPAGGPTPPPVQGPGPGTATITIAVGGNDMRGTAEWADGAPITCSETGVTLNTVGCDANFSVIAVRLLYNFSTPGGGFQSCFSPFNGYQFGGGSTTGYPGSEELIFVTVT